MGWEDLTPLTADEAIHKLTIGDHADAAASPHIGVDVGLADLICDGDLAVRVDKDNRLHIKRLR